MSQPPGWLAQGRWRGFILVGALGITQAIAMGIAAFATRDLFEALHLESPLPVLALATLATASCGVVWLRVWSRIRGEQLGQAFAAAWRQVLFAHLTRLPLSTIESRRQGALGLRFVGDLSAMRNWLGEALPRILSGMVVLPGAAVTLYWLDPALAVVVMPPILLSLIIALIMAPRLGPAHADLRRKRANLAIAMMERVSVASELALSGRRRKELRNLAKDSAALARSAIARRVAASCLAGLPETGVALAAIGIFWVTSQAELAASEVAAGLAVLGILLVPLRELAGCWNRYCAWRIAHAKCCRILGLPRLPALEVEHGAALPVVFENVRFRDIHLDLVIEPGSVVGFHSRPGAGKSSLLRLAAGLEQPDTGLVHFGREGVRPKTIHIGASTPILQGSLRRALSLGIQPRPDDQVIANAAEVIGLYPLIARLGGLGGHIAEGGRNLAASERLRIHLCRAELTMPGLLVIDYPAELSEPWLQEALGRITRNRQTTLLFSTTAPDQRCQVDRWLDIEALKPRDRCDANRHLVLVKAS